MLLLAKERNKIISKGAMDIYKLLNKNRNKTYYEASVFHPGNTGQKKKGNDTNIIYA